MANCNRWSQSFEGGGGALPEYASREGCVVEAQDWCHGDGRQFGGFGNMQKVYNSVYNAEICLAPRRLDFGSAAAPRMR